MSNSSINIFRIISWLILWRPGYHVQGNQNQMAKINCTDNPMGVQENCWTQKDKCSRKHTVELTLSIERPCVEMSQTIIVTYATMNNGELMHEGAYYRQQWSLVNTHNNRKCKAWGTCTPTKEK